MPIINMVYKKKWLPSIYQKVDYIQSSWTQRIDTGIRPDDNNYWFVCKFNIVSFSWDGNVMNLWKNSTDDSRYWFWYSWIPNDPNRQAWNPRWSWWATIWDSSLVLNKDFVAEYNYNWNTFNIDGVQKATLTYGSNSYNVNWNIFCQAYWSWTYTRYWIFKLYYMKIYHWTTLIRDFVPCYRKSDGEIWLYDLVGKQFYTNSWSWTFTIPPQQYLRWTITANRNNLTVTQMSEFEICNSSWTKMARPTWTTITWNIVWPWTETVDKLIDGSTSTKYCPNGSLPIIIMIGLPTKIDFSIYNKYKRYTANDESGRDPKSRTLETSADGVTWTTISTVTNANITTSRYALAWTWDITLP